MKRLLDSINFVGRCRRYGVGLFACPEFLFVAMGLVIVIVTGGAYVIGQKYVDPEPLALAILIASGFLIVIAFTIMSAFERLVDTKMSEAEHSKDLLELKDQFVFIAAHELRTPVNAIKWGLDELLSREPAIASKNKELIDILKESNERLLALVGDVLEIARIEGKTITVKLASVSAHDAAEEAAGELQKLSSDKRVTVANEISKGFPLVFGDATRLKEVFINLISNAVKYNNEGGSVRVRGAVEDGRVVLSVSDNGVGLSEEDQKHIFEKFWRAKATEGAEGTGLGLFIVKQLVERMEGKAWFESKRGEGTTFSFSLRLADERIREAGEHGSEKS